VLLAGLGQANAHEDLLPCRRRADWRLMTGCDPKNIPGPITTAVVGLSCSGFDSRCAKTGRSQMAHRDRDRQKRLKRDQWAEYYDGKRVA